MLSMLKNYVLDENGNPVEELDGEKWCKFFFCINNRSLAYTQLGDTTVSTVFLGMDHRFFGEGPPILWETMIFGGQFNDDCQRYTSKEDALEGHAAMVEKVKRFQVEGTLLPPPDGEEDE